MSVKMKCEVCNRELGTRHANVRVCPNCYYIKDAQPLLKLLEDLKINPSLRKRIEREIDRLKKRAKVIHKLKL